MTKYEKKYRYITVNDLSTYENVQAAYYMKDNEVFVFKVGEDVGPYHFISSIGSSVCYPNCIIGISNKINAKFTGHYNFEIIKK